MNRKKFTIIIIVLVFFLPFAFKYSYLLEDLNLNPNDYARITDVDYTAVVIDDPDSGGSVLITERITFDIHAASSQNLFWELWRDLPEDNIDGVYVDYEVHSVKQILDNGSEIYFKESPKLYWDESDYLKTNRQYGPGKWFHSKGPYSPNNERYECVFFYVDGLYREEVVFEIQYEIHNAALRYNDCSDLYLSLYSGSTIKYLDSFKAQILFPNEDMPAPGNYDVFSYGTNAHSFPINESATRNPGYYTFFFELNEEDLRFRPSNRYIEFDLVAYNDDKHRFTEYAPANMYSFDNVLDEIYDEQKAYANSYHTYATAAKIIFVICLLGGATALTYAFILDKRMNMKYIFNKPEYEYYYFKEVPGHLDPNFARALVFCKHETPKDDSGVYSALLLSLVRKKYIELNELYRENDVEIKILYHKPDNTYVDPTSEPFIESLSVCEENYFNLLNHHAPMGSIRMSDFQQRIKYDFENTRSFISNMKSSIVNIGIKDFYFQKADYLQPKQQVNSLAKALILFGFVSLTVLNIIFYFTPLYLAYGAFFILGICFILSSFILKKKANKYVLLTQLGENEYAKWRGFYNYLNNEGLLKDSSVSDYYLWEDFLIYATAFGLSEKVVNALEIKLPTETVASSPILSERYYRTRRYHYHTGRSFRTSVRGSSFSGSGYSGGGFGYGGGGRGGGGGGGGH